MALGDSLLPPGLTPDHRCPSTHLLPQHYSVLSDVWEASISRTWVPHKGMEKLPASTGRKGRSAQRRHKKDAGATQNTQATLLRPQLQGSLTTISSGVTPGCVLRPSVS